MVRAQPYFCALISKLVNVEWKMLDPESVPPEDLTHRQIPLVNAFGVIFLYPEVNASPDLHRTEKFSRTVKQMLLCCAGGKRTF